MHTLNHIYDYVLSGRQYVFYIVCERAIAPLHLELRGKGAAIFCKYKSTREESAKRPFKSHDWDIDAALLRAANIKYQ